MSSIRYFSPLDEEKTRIIHQLIKEGYDLYTTRVIKNGEILTIDWKDIVKYNILFKQKYDIVIDRQNKTKTGEVVLTHAIR